MTSALPFARLLVPYDASEPSRAALKLAVELVRDGGTLVIVTVVDEAAVIAESASTMVAVDPAPLMDLLDEEGTDEIDEAAGVARAAGIDPVLDTVHDTPVAGILQSAERHACDLIVMGTHARTGVARMFLGSTTEGVLRQSVVPVLVVPVRG